MTTTPLCPHCGASMKKFWHAVTPGITYTLIKLNKAVNFYQKNDIDIHHLPADLAFDHIQKTNWTKLRFNALVAKIRVEGKVKRGRWCITRKGYQYLGGKAIPKEAQSFRNKVTAHSEEMVTISQVLRSSPYWQSIEDIRFDYAEPTIEMDADIDGRTVPTVMARATRKNKGKPLCPRCHNVLAVDITTKPDEQDPNRLIIIAKNRVCRKCGYHEPVLT